MFTKLITETQFSNIDIGVTVQGIRLSEGTDVSFDTSLKILLINRLKNDTIKLTKRRSTYSENAIKGTSADALLNAIDIPEYEKKENHILLHEFASVSENDNLANIKNIEKNFVNVYGGDWIRVEKITVFYSKFFNVLVFINPKIKSVFLFTEKLDPRKLHFLQCSIPAFLPWYFDQESGLLDYELELINSLRSTDGNSYISAVNKAAEIINIREAKIKRLLDGFETRYEAAEAEREKCRISSYNDDIRNLNEQIGELIEKINESQIRLLGLVCKQKEECESEIMEYFLRNKNVSLESVNDEAMTFVCKGYVEYFDEECAKMIIDNRSSYVYRIWGHSLSSAIAPDDMKKLMYAIFIDQTIKMRVCASYTLQLHGCVRANSCYDYGTECDSYTPNTHIDRYACMGNYSRVINSMLQNLDYIGAVEQCMASTQSINFTDSTVMEEFMLRMYGKSEYHVNTRCLELPDGSIVTPKKAIAWLNLNEEEEQDE